MFYVHQPFPPLYFRKLIKIKIKLNFYVHTSLRCLKRTDSIGGLDHIKTIPLICRGKQGTGFYMIGKFIKAWKKTNGAVFKKACYKNTVSKTLENWDQNIRVRTLWKQFLETLKFIGHVFQNTWRQLLFVTWQWKYLQACLLSCKKLVWNIFFKFSFQRL